MRWFAGLARGDRGTTRDASAIQCGEIGSGVCGRRVAVLTDGPARLFDPRPAATLLPRLESLEERLLRHETGLSRAMRPGSVEEVGQVLMAMLREEVERNEPALSGRSIHDLPELVQHVVELAQAYRPDPRYALQLSQRKVCIPGLLASFLAVELHRNGWRARYRFPLGLGVEIDSQSIHPPHGGRRPY